MTLRVVCVVEGHAETETVPILLRRIAEHGALYDLVVPPPLRVPKSRLLKKTEFERAVDLAGRKAGPGGTILVLLDADEDCPAELGPRLLEWARGARGDVVCAVVLAKREVEAWFLASIGSLRGHRRIRPDISPPPDAEQVGDAKGWLSSAMEPGARYGPVKDQAALGQVFDLELARSQSPSFDKFFRDASRLLRIPDVRKVDPGSGE